MPTLSGSSLRYHALARWEFHRTRLRNRRLRGARLSHSATRSPRQGFEQCRALLRPFVSPVVQPDFQSRGEPTSLCDARDLITCLRGQDCPEPPAGLPRNIKMWPISTEDESKAVMSASIEIKNEPTDCNRYLEVVGHTVTGEADDRVRHEVTSASWRRRTESQGRLWPALFAAPRSSDRVPPVSHNSRGAS